MTTLEFARHRLQMMLEEIRRMKESDFPYPHPEEALLILEKLFSHQCSVLGKVSSQSNPKVVNNACRIALDHLFIYLPILGFLLRSTNVRNSFESYYPLLRLAKSIVGGNAKLIISSEWDYSPLVYNAIDALPGFVLMGLPAPESSNPLLLPLAGHELGHSVWERKQIGKKYDQLMIDRIMRDLTNKSWSDYSLLYPSIKKEELQSGTLFVSSTWMPAYTWASLQAEEIFCDCFGIRLFGESYLLSFGYLLAPGTSGQRSLQYPNILRRVRHMVQTAEYFGVEVPINFESGFESDLEPADPAAKLLVSIADRVTESLLPNIQEDAKQIAQECNVPSASQIEVESIRAQFSRVVPTAKSHSLTDILNAGWKCYRDPSFWSSVPQIRGDDRGRVLRDLMLKSMEVSEVLTRIGDN